MSGILISIRPERISSKIGVAVLNALKTADRVIVHDPSLSAETLAALTAQTKTVYGDAVKVALVRGDTTPKGMTSNVKTTASKFKVGVKFAPMIVDGDENALALNVYKV